MENLMGHFIGIFFIGFCLYPYVSYVVFQTGYRLLHLCDTNQTVSKVERLTGKQSFFFNKIK